MAVRRTRRHIPMHGPLRTITAKIPLTLWDDVEDHAWSDRQTLSEFLREALDREVRRRMKLRSMAKAR